jgi:hypothetical protein
LIESPDAAVSRLRSLSRHGGCPVPKAAGSASVPAPSVSTETPRTPWRFSGPPGPNWINRATWIGWTVAGAGILAGETSSVPSCKPQVPRFKTLQGPIDKRDGAPSIWSTGNHRTTGRTTCDGWRRSTKSRLVAT